MSLIYEEGLTPKAVLHVFARAPGFLCHKVDHLETAFGQQGHIAAAAAAAATTTTTTTTT